VDFEEELKSKEACKIAKEYYMGDGNQMYLFDEMHICTETAPTARSHEESNIIVDEESGTFKRRPNIKSLYDVFVAIRNDEIEHVKTMAFLQEEESDIQICNVDY
jgi:hypothetical protein